MINYKNITTCIFLIFNICCSNELEISNDNQKKKTSKNTTLQEKKEIENDIKIKKFIEKSRSFINIEWGIDKRGGPIINLYITKNAKKELSEMKSIIGDSDFYKSLSKEIMIVEDLIKKIEKPSWIYTTSKTALEVINYRNSKEFRSKIDYAKINILIGNLYFRAKENKKAMLFYEDGLKAYENYLYKYEDRRIEKELIYVRFHLASLYSSNYLHNKSKEQRLEIQKKTTPNILNISQAIIDCNNNNLKDECIIL